ncbi:MAG: helix-turn-helix domain-containing protein [Myxococcaceae bacterium]|nr:helix-turn-helix domain-containing protein [Myxococcaceae bacterium]
MAKSWKQFIKGVEAEAQASGAEHNRALRTLRSYYRQLGAELAEERKKLGISQETLAKATGIDQAEISRIERDLVDPRLQTYVKLLDGMGLRLRVEPVGRGRLESRRRLSARTSRT